VIIRHMKAGFGCLNQAELSLEPGLNIMEAPNESGKSTWTAFIRCMLYGVDSSRRGPLTDRQRYAPWDGSPMEGRLQLSHEGKDITLYRRSLHGPMRDFAALYSGSGTEVGGLGPTDAGQQLTGMSESVFVRSAFVRQGAMLVDNSPELEKRLSSLLTAGDEGASFAEAEQRLRSWQRSRRSRGRGHIPVLEAEIASIRAELEHMDALEAELAALEEEAEQAGERWKSRLQLAERAAEQRRARLDNARAELSALEDAALAAERRCGTEPLAPAGVGRSLWLLWAALILASAAALLYEYIWGLIPLAVGLLGVVWDVMRFRQQRRAQLQYEEKVERRHQLMVLAAGYRREAETAAAGLRQQEELLLRPDRQEQETLREAEALFRTAREACAAKSGELRSRGDRMVLETKLRSLCDELQREEEKYAALEIALQELQSAYEELQSRFSPLLARRTAAIFSRLTGGRYSEVLLQQSLTALVQRRGESVPRESALLSRGAAEQLYLSLRLALLDLLDEEGCCPLVLDDAFVSFDVERLRLALELLLEIGEKRQIILFTCQNRESSMLEEIKKADR